MQEWMKPIVKQIEKIALKFDDVEKQYLSKHLSFKFESQTLFYLKTDDEKITLGCNKGYLLEDKFTFDYASKYMRHLYITNNDDFNEEIIHNYINEAIICSIELNEKNRMKQNLRRK